MEELDTEVDQISLVCVQILT